MNIFYLWTLYGTVIQYVANEFKKLGKKLWSGTLPMRKISFWGVITQFVMTASAGKAKTRLKNTKTQSYKTSQTLRKQNSLLIKGRQTLEREWSY